MVGAGLSAKSGIPTFRGKGGFWVAGSKNYKSTEIGTKRMFNINFNEVWRWYLYRMSICKKANPNVGHIALHKIEKQMGNRFELISQNVDGLHFRKECQIERLSLIHGDLTFMRCANECSHELYQIPSNINLVNRTTETPITLEETQLLVCPKCNNETRPHVLWFDESYNEHFYKVDSSLRIARDTGILFTVGTSGETNLPQMIVQRVLSVGGKVIDINPSDNVISNSIRYEDDCYHIKDKAGKVLNEIFELIIDKV